MLDKASQIKSFILSDVLFVLPKIKICTLKYLNHQIIIMWFKILY